MKAKKVVAVFMTAAMPVRVQQPELRAQGI